MYAAYRMNQSIVTRTLNLERGELALKPYCDGIVSNFPGNIISPHRIAKTERFVRSHGRVYLNTELVLEPDISKLRTTTPSSAIHFKDSAYTHSRYRFLYCSAPTQHKRRGKPNRPTIYLWYMEDATRQDVLKAFFHASLIRSTLEMSDIQSPDKELKEYELVLRDTMGIAEKLFPEMVRELERLGWEVENNHLRDVDHPISPDM
jgi:hypothetical protein